MLWNDPFTSDMFKIDSFITQKYLGCCHNHRDSCQRYLFQRAVTAEKIMFDILVMFLFFLASVGVHLTVCRKRSQEGLLLKPFIGIAIGNLCVLWVFFWLSQRYVHFDPTSFWGVPLHAAATLIYVLLIPTYLVFYFSTQQLSPTKKIFLLRRS